MDNRKNVDNFIDKGEVSGVRPGSQAITQDERPAVKKPVAKAPINSEPVVAVSDEEKWNALVNRPKAKNVTPLAGTRLAPKDIPEFEDTPERRNTLELRKKRHFRRKLRDWGVFTGYLTPSFVGVLIFFFMPLLMLLKTSFQKSPTNADFVGFRNYGRVLTNDAFIAASKNTLTFALISVPLAVVLALLVALLLNSGLPGKSLFRSFLLNPMMVPVASVVLIWQVFFSYNGVVNGIAEKLFDSPDKIDWLKSSYAQVVIMLLFIWKNLGYNMVLFLAALNSVPHDILESAQMDGAGPLRRFFSIKLHYLSPTLFFVGIMSLINSFKIFREVYLLTGDYPFDNLYMLQHFMNNSFTHLDYSKLSAGAIIMCIVMVVIVGGLFFAESKFDKDVED
ncbi:MAG: sugar ABC transporter permease [Saccharofermentans sp.]|nr:sugar ABC transporter permease [Saccharofermentans sp.]